MNGIKSKVDYNLADLFGNTPLHYCCRSAQTELVTTLLHGKAVHRGNIQHLYPIHMAIESKDPNTINLLQGNHADTADWLHSDKYSKLQPIHTAAKCGEVWLI